MLCFLPLCCPLDPHTPQRSANDALLAWVGVRQARLGSAIDLFKALGGGWKDDFKAESLRNSGAEDPLAPPAATADRRP